MYANTNKATGGPVPGTPVSQYSSSAGTHHQQQQGQHEPLVYVGKPIYDTGDCPSELVKTTFVSQGYKDVWAAVLFIIQLLIVFVWGCINMHRSTHSWSDHKTENCPNNGEDCRNYGNVEKYMMTIPEAAGCALITALLSLALMRASPKSYIIVTNVLSILMLIAATIYCFVSGGNNTFMGVCFIFIALINILWLYLVRKRIPFASVLLQRGSSITARHYGTIIASLISLLALVVFLAFFLFMAIPVMIDVSDNNNSNNNLIYLVLSIFMLMFYWSTQVITNVVHTTACGTAATYFFAGPDFMPRNPTVASAKRTLTTSFGSVCFGSLVVAILELIRAWVRHAARQSNSFIGCIAAVIIGCIESLMEYFNTYAFSHIAIYGTSYIEAAKQTWNMIKEAGWTAIINDTLVFPVITITSFFNSLFLAVIFGAAKDSILIGIMVFCISYAVHIVILRVMYSSVMTLLVCFVENPEILLTSNPQFHHDLLEALEVMKEPVCDCN